MATEYPDEVDTLIAPWILERTKEELSILATESGVALAPVRTADEVIADVAVRPPWLLRDGGERRGACHDSRVACHLATPLVHGVSRYGKAG